MVRPRLHLIAPTAPPAVCGVGDHSALLAEQLDRRVPTLVHFGQTNPAPELPGIEHRVDFDHDHPSTLGTMSGLDDFRQGDAVLVQYTNFAYGRWGFNPWLAPALRRWKRNGLLVATMFHETYMGPPRGIKIRLMRAWQKHFFRQVGRASDLCLFSVEPWTREYRSWFPRARVETLAVGSNIPRLPLDRAQKRLELGLPEGVPVLGVFGGTHPSRLFEWVVETSRHLQEIGVDHRILRIGPNAEEVAKRLAGAPLVDRGIQDPRGVSEGLSCCDVFLSPISDGASSRRGSLLAGLGHGLPCISTLGDSSDDLFRQASGRSIEYAKDSQDFARLVAALLRDGTRRSQLGQAALEFHDRHFSWDFIAERFLALLGESGWAGKASQDPR